MKVWWVGFCVGVDLEVVFGTSGKNSPIGVYQQDYLLDFAFVQEHLREDVERASGQWVNSIKLVRDIPLHRRTVVHYSIDEDRTKLSLVTPPPRFEQPLHLLIFQTRRAGRRESKTPSCRWRCGKSCY